MCYIPVDARMQTRMVGWAKYWCPAGCAPAHCCRHEWQTPAPGVQLVAHLLAVAGTSGRRQPLVSNLFLLERNQVFSFVQYHVDFNPEVPNPRIRSSMIHGFEDLLGPVRMFDGTILFLPFKLERDVRRLA